MKTRPSCSCRFTPTLSRQRLGWHFLGWAKSQLEWKTIQKSGMNKETIKATGNILYIEAQTFIQELEYANNNNSAINISVIVI